mmetsp:Transcript_43996/g.95608  ORF Transcript_43996/g.95608 Transcript_43996/m.95608 type:complete len:399 (-) Transcript_43996:83-1279(-)
MARHLWPALVILAVQGRDDGKSARCTNSMSLLQATSAKSRITPDMDVGDDFLNFSGKVTPPNEVNRSSLASEVTAAAARSHALFQTAVHTVNQEVSTSLSQVGTSSAGATISFLIVSVLAVTLVAAFLCIRPDLPVSPPKKENPRDSLRKDHLQLPADALSKRGSMAFTGSPAKGRSPMRSPIAGPASPSEDGLQPFCPDLIVPRGCECVLLVPIVPLCLGPFSVCDPNGHVVLRVSPKSMAPPPSIDRGRGSARKFVSFGPDSLGSSWRIELATGSGDLLAQSSFCKPGQNESSSHPSFALMRADGGHFATLLRNQQEGYELTTPDHIIYFWGSFDHHAVNITDEGGKLLATTELCRADWDQTGEFYRLRVAPLVDVGLLLCSLVCIDQVMAMSRRT